MRIRSLAAVLIIIGGLFAYALGVMLVAELLPANQLVKAAFFAAAGLLWVVPAACLLRWMARPT